MRVLALMQEAYGANGGIAKFNRDLLEAIAAHPTCEQVEVIVRVAPSEAESVPPKVVYRHGLTTGKLSYMLAASQFGLFGSRCDFVVCGHINLLPIARAIGARFAAPLLLVLHGIEAWKPASQWLTNRAIGKVDFFACVSECTKSRFLSWAKLNESRGFILPNCVRLEDFGARPPAADLVQRYKLADKRVIMTLGRLDARERYKGVDQMLEALPVLLASVPSLVYLVCGGGSDQARLEAKADRLGLAGKAIFTGFIPEHEKLEHYLLADAFVLAGSGEGFGIVLLEAMACGVPVVASKLDGSREAVRHGRIGSLVDPDDSRDLVRGVLEALDRPKGLIPKGLSFFSYRYFEERVHKMIEAIMNDVWRL